MRQVQITLPNRPQGRVRARGPVRNLCSQGTNRGWKAAPNEARHDRVRDEVSGW